MSHLSIHMYSMFHTVDHLVAEVRLQGVVSHLDHLALNRQLQPSFVHCIWYR